MWRFREKKKRTVTDLINQTSIEELLKEASACYHWNLSETHAVLLRCTTLEHFVSLHTYAFSTYMHPNYNFGRPINIEVLDAIYLSVLKGFNQFVALNEGSFDTLERIKNIYENLASPWIDRKNSDEREMLRNRLRVLWQDITSSLFAELKVHSNIKIDDGTEKGARNDDLIEKYNKLYSFCKKDDPVVFEIAHELNRCYAVG
ncbi:hypothetical protein JXE04_02740 [Patescibacteria group bacterium]|nr:hypothetical protein [Patescibacteria group bacterium]